MRYKLLIFFAGLLLTGSLKAQDTLFLMNKTSIACTVTEIGRSSIEYLLPGDQKNYRRVDRSRVYYARYANGKSDTFNPVLISQTSAAANDSLIAPREAYDAGFVTGYNNYKPQTERVLGAASWVIAYWSIAVPITVSASKIKAKSISDPAFVQSTNQNFREGYLNGANRRRRGAVWSAYGLTGAGIAGVVIGAALIL